MAIQTMKTALERADATESNKEGFCQQQTRGYFDAPSVGDRDGDRDSDANDGWASEPHSARVLDRNPPAGAPVYFSKPGGFGHRAISRGNGIIRSTDFDTKSKRYKARSMGNGTIAEIERAMGVKYVGWSKTISGFLIPPEPAPTRRKQRPANVRKALDSLRAEMKISGARDKELVNKAKDILLKIDPR